jgi:small conductance mechanosensitive channel
MVTSGVQLLLKLLVFLIIVTLFRYLARVTTRIVARALSTTKLSLSSLLKDAIVSVAGKVVFLLGILIGLSQIGVQLGPVLAGLGVIGFIVGFALQDTLSNFASGAMIVIYRPFDIGDVVEAGGVFGKVDAMTLVSTGILTFDNQRLTVPNRKIWGEVIRNVTSEDTRRVDLTFSVGYSDSLDRAEEVLHKIVTDHPLVLPDPEPVIKVQSLAESSVDFVVRPWCKTEDYWSVYWDLTRSVKSAFDSEGISIPFPQQDVHLYQQV